MATIDIRASVSCSLGTLISGSISDDYIQGSGLVKTRGSVELKGVLTPAVGTAVTFSYTRDGVTTSVPRKLRVLSSFADPFRQTTKVELGCLLTYKAGVTPAPTVDGEAAETSGRQQQCLNGYIDYPADSPVPIPVLASGVMDTCLSRLGITASSNPLTNRFNLDSFDLSAGYVQVLGDLLLSEGYVGYMDADDVLQVRDLATEGGTGPVIDTSSLIDLDAIGVGDLPGEAVIVRYNALKLKGDVDPNDTALIEARNWEKEEVVGTPQTVQVRYTATDGTATASSHTYVPYTKTITEYGEDASFQDDVCVIASSRGEGADLSGSVIRRTSEQRTIMAAAANNYCAQLLSSGISVNPNQQGVITTVEEYEYDDKGEQIRQTVKRYEPAFQWAGGLGIEFVYPTTGGGLEAVTLDSTPVLVEEVITENVNIYADRPRFISLKPGEVWDEAVEGQKVTVTRYQNWAVTLNGQQGTASIKEIAPFTSASAASSWLLYASGVMTMVDCQVRTQRGRGGVVGQVRPRQALRLGQAGGVERETTAQLAYAMGSASSERFASFSMPYQSDDTYTAAGVVVKGNAEAKALRFGRIQNRLLLGNRNGVNLQVHPSKMPAAPFDPLYLSNGSLMVQYRANAINWAFSSDGIVCSVDALFWGVAGGTGTAWVPIAPGITTFPALPAVDGSGNTSVDAVVPPWNEEVPMEGITTTGVVVQDYAYQLALGTTDLGVLATRTTLLIGTRLPADATSYSFSGQAATLKRGYKVQSAAGSFGVSGYGAGSLRNRIIGTNAGTFASTGQIAALLYNRLPLAAGAVSFVMSGQAAGSFSGKTLAAAAGIVAVSGQVAGLNATRVLTATAGSLAVVGQSATLQIADPYASNVSLLLHMDGANNSTTFADNSTNAVPVATVGGAKISTASFKFNGASGYFDGAGDRLTVANEYSPLFQFGAGDFTIEMWLNPDDAGTTRGLVSLASSGSSAASWALIRDATGFVFAFGTSGSISSSRTSSYTFTPGTWIHFAIARSGNILRMFVDGSQIGSDHSITVALFSATTNLVVGAQYFIATTQYKGYMDDLRITKGVARYTANFTPPIAAFPNP